MADSKLSPLQLHSEKLGTLCRVCAKGGLKTKRPKVQVTKFAETLKQLYKYDITLDKREVHPMKVCSSCEGKLRRADPKKNPTIPANLPAKLPEFFPHADGCNICFKKPGRPATKKEEDADEGPPSKMAKPTPAAATLASTSRVLFPQPPAAKTIPALDLERCEVKEMGILLQCSCCQQIPCEPIMLQCADIACQSCIRKLLQLGVSACTACGAAFEADDIKPLEGKALYLLEALPFKCKYAPKGCSEIKKRGDLIEHEDVCPFKFATQKFLAPTTGTKRGAYKKRPLFSDDLLETTRKDRTDEASDYMKTWAKDRKEDLGDTLAYLLKREWTRAADDRLGPFLRILNNNEWTGQLSVDQCLALRVTNLQSKAAYEQNYMFNKQCLGTGPQSVYQPPSQLISREYNYMPATTRYFIESPETCYYHTPVKQVPKGTKTLATIAIDTHTLEPIDVLEDFTMYEFPTPNLKGVRWRYWDALAKTLEELDNEVKAGLNKLDLDPEDEKHTLIATVKDGADGMGDIAVHVEKSDRFLPDKAFRFAFTVIGIDVKINGERKNVSTNESPNSVKCTRPLLEAIADENNHGSCTVMMQPIEEEREFLKEKILKIDCNGQWRHYQTNFYTSMVDEKFSRAESGLKGSGGKFICTLCKATRVNCKTNLGTFTIDRTHKEVVEKSQLLEINPDKLSPADLETLAMGVKLKPLLLSEPVEQGIDATHADINLGIFFRKVIIREIAQLKEWEVKKDTKYLFDDAEVKFDVHLKRHIGINPLIMMPGNYARQLFAEENEEVVVELVEDVNRRMLLKEMLSLFRNICTVYRALQPLKTHPELTANVKNTALQMGHIMKEEFPYVQWSNYFHKIIEHTQELIENESGPGSIGGLSGEGNEAGNKLFRKIRLHLARKNSTYLGLRDVLWVHWLYTSPHLQNLGTVVRKQKRCTNCLELGHNISSCKRPKAQVAQK